MSTRIQLSPCPPESAPLRIASPRHPHYATMTMHKPKPNLTITVPEKTPPPALQDVHISQEQHQQRRHPQQPHIVQPARPVQAEQCDTRRTLVVTTYPLEAPSIASGGTTCSDKSFACCTYCEERGQSHHDGDGDDDGGDLEGKTWGRRCSHAWTGFWAKKEVVMALLDTMIMVQLRLLIVLLAAVVMYGVWTCLVVIQK